MNLYELAHHPEAWNHRSSNQGDNELWWGCNKTSTKEQFNMLHYPNYTNGDSIQDHTDEFSFRMHLLFVYFATTDEKEWP